MIVGLIPASGKASRIGGIPKMLLPIADNTLLGRMYGLMNETADQVYVSSNPVTAGIVDDYLRNKFGDMSMCYQNTRTMNDTVLRMVNYEDGASRFMVGMPDTYFSDDQAFAKLNAALDDAPVAVGVWRLREGQQGQGGQCKVKGGRVVDVIDKDPDCDYPHIWGLMAWRAGVRGYINPTEPHVGYALKAMIQTWLCPVAVEMDGYYYDCGTFERYHAMLNEAFVTV